MALTGMVDHNHRDVIDDRTADRFAHGIVPSAVLTINLFVPCPASGAWRQQLGSVDDQRCKIFFMFRRLRTNLCRSIEPHVARPMLSRVARSPALQTSGEAHESGVAGRLQTPGQTSLVEPCSMRTNLARSIASVRASSDCESPGLAAMTSKTEYCAGLISRVLRVRMKS